jgi:hypothetical protein
MKLTDTHFILGTILFVVIMISLTTSCCDFAPYARSRSSLGMSVYEGMDEKEGMDDEEEEGMADKTKEGVDGDDDEEPKPKLEVSEGFAGNDKKEPVPFTSSMFGMALSGF